MGKESTRAKDKAVAPPVVDIGTTLQNIFSSRAMPSPSASVQKKKSLFTKVGKGSVKDVKGGVGDGKTLKSTQFQEVAGAFQLPKWMGAIIFNKIISWEQSRDPAAVVPSPSLTYETARQYYDMELHGKNPVWRLFHTIRQDPARPYLIPSDMYPLVKELLRVHPGLEFLKQTPEFMDKYAETVVIRMFYYVDNTANGKITYSQFERSNLPSVMLRLDDEDDINVVRDYFSYEHFYVLYCKFWELDTDRDYLIGKADLARYGGGCVSAKALDRVVNGHARRLSSGKPGKLNFEDFVWFCISEEDKSTPQSLLYWFRVVDLDNDGILAGFEIDVFLQEQKARMHQMSIEAIALEDIVCQMIDMVKPKDPKCITMRDFRACPTAGVFFNVLMNLNKFLIFEQRDPFAAHAEKQLAEKTDWDRFARSEYDRMALEAEGGDDDLDGHASWK
jgi:Ca2+-binding EF-hand superfamily protein